MIKQNIIYILFMLIILFGCSGNDDDQQYKGESRSTVSSQIDTLDNVIVKVDITTQSTGEKFLYAFDNSKKIDELIEVLKEIEFKGTETVTVKHQSNTMLIILLGVFILIILIVIFKIKENTITKGIIISGLTLISIPITLKILDIDFSNNALFQNNYYNGKDNTITEIIKIDSLLYSEDQISLKNDSLLQVKAINICLNYLKYAPDYLAFISNENSNNDRNSERIEVISNFLLKKYLLSVRQNEVLKTVEDVKTKYREIKTKFKDDVVYIYFLR